MFTAADGYFGSQMSLSYERRKLTTKITATGCECSQQPTNQPNDQPTDRTDRTNQSTNHTITLRLLVPYLLHRWDEGASLLLNMCYVHIILDLVPCTTRTYLRTERRAKELLLPLLLPLLLLLLLLLLGKRDKTTRRARWGVAGYQPRTRGKTLADAADPIILADSVEHFIYSCIRKESVLKPIPNALSHLVWKETYSTLPRDGEEATKSCGRETALIQGHGAEHARVVPTGAVPSLANGRGGHVSAWADVAFEDVRDEVEVRHDGGYGNRGTVVEAPRRVRR